MTVEKDIETALFARMASLTLTPTLPIEWPNREASPPVAGTSHLVVRHLRNDNERLFLKGSNPHLRRGILQVDVMTPLGAGATGATEIAATIAAHFPAGLSLYGDDVRVEIEAAPTVHGAIPLDAWWQTPVSIPYRSYA